MWKNILIWFFTLAVLGCTGTLTKETDRPDDNQVENITDYSLCQGNPSSSIEGQWLLRQKQGHFTFTSILAIYSSQVRLTAECRYKDQVVAPQVFTTAHFDQNYLHISSSKKRTASLRESDLSFECAAEISRGSFLYSFQGRCLVLQDPTGERTTLIPYY